MRVRRAYELRLTSVRGAYHRAHSAVSVLADELLSPSVGKSRHRVVQRHAVAKLLVLQLSRCGIGCLDEYEYALVVSLALVYERLDAVAAEIAVDGDEIALERSARTRYPLA